MTSTLTALLFGVSIATWVYVQFSRRTGSGNTSSALIGAAAAGIMVFLFFFTLLKYVIHLD